MHTQLLLRVREKLLSWGEVESNWKASHHGSSFPKVDVCDSVRQLAQSCMGCLAFLLMLPSIDSCWSNNNLGWPYWQHSFLQELIKMGSYIWIQKLN
ncbi:hypothetical protein BS78_08G034500 [Paspalum vaginatum]|nr:hypothetical protein BS78_08G034500 [Paspalum vaginatum]